MQSEKSAVMLRKSFYNLQVKFYECLENISEFIKIQSVIAYFTSRFNINNSTISKSLILIEYTTQKAINTYQVSISSHNTQTASHRYNFQSLQIYTSDIFPFNTQNPIAI